MKRLFDFECVECGHIHDSLVDVAMGESPPKRVDLSCPSCGEHAAHMRVMSLVAQYMYDKPYRPAVYGGKFDTMGHRQAPKGVELPDHSDFDQARDYLRSKDHKERKRETWNRLQENANKRKRAEAMKKHPTMDIRNTPLPGDPKLD